MILLISISCLSLSFLTLIGTTYLSLIKFHKLQTLRVLDRNDKFHFMGMSILLSFSMGGFLALLLIHNKSLRLTLNERLDEVRNRPMIVKLARTSFDREEKVPRGQGYIPWAMKPYGELTIEDRYRHVGTPNDFPPLGNSDTESEPGFVNFPVGFFSSSAPSKAVTLNDIKDVDEVSTRLTVVDKLFRRYR